MKACVLVIDSYEGFRSAMEFCLSQVGIAVLSADSLMTALPLVRQRAVDVVLLDAVHSFDRGLTECRVLKGWPALADTPVVLLADRVIPIYSERAREAGAETVMPKLFDWQEMLRELERLASRRGRASEP